MLIGNIIGWVATVLSIIMYAPQSYKTWKTKDTSTMSKITMSFVIVGGGMWILFCMMINPHSWQGWSTNVVIALLMIPIIWYLFKNKIFSCIFYLFLILVFIGSLIFILTDFKANQIIKYIIGNMAGSFCSVSFIPQTIRIVRDKNVGSMSIASILFISIANAMWVVYWILIMDPNGQDYISVIMSLSWASLGALLQVPSIIVYFTNKKPQK